MIGGCCVHIKCPYNSLGYIQGMRAWHGLKPDSQDLSIMPATHG